MKQHLLQLVCLTVVCTAMCSTALLADETTPPDHIVVPQCRHYGFANDREPVIELVQVKTSIDLIDDVMAKTTLLIELNNHTDTQQLTQLWIVVPETVTEHSITSNQTAESIAAHLTAPSEATGMIRSLVTHTNDPACMEFYGAALLRSESLSLVPQAHSTYIVSYEQPLSLQQNRVDYCLLRSESLTYQVPWDITVTLTSQNRVGVIYSPSHRIDTSRINAYEAVVQNVDASKSIPGPFQLHYLSEAPEPTASILAYPSERYDGGTFLLLAGLPNDPNNDAYAMKRELTLVLDRSGSMRGHKIEQVKEAAGQVISGLQDNEAFNLITYSSDITHFSSDPLLKNETTEAMALNHIRTLSAGGGTNLHGALKEALLQRPTPGTLPLILFLTDGLPTSGETSELAIRDLILSSNPYKRRVYTLGVGYDLNAPLLDAMAAHSFARSMFVTEEDQVETAIRDVFQSVAIPMLTDFSVRSITQDGLYWSDRIYNVLPFVVHDLFKGDQLVLAGQYVGQSPFRIGLRGTYLQEERLFTYAFDPNSASVHNGTIGRLWAARVVAQIINEIRDLGADPQLRITNDRLWDLSVAMVDFSLRFGILTEYTAFWATGETDLLDYPGLLMHALDDLYDRAVLSRRGKAAINQSVNLEALTYQSVLNRYNRFLDRNMEPVRTLSIQQMNDLAFYHYNGIWTEGNLVMPLPDMNDSMVTRDIPFGSADYFELADRLTHKGRQGALSLGQDVMMWDNGSAVYIDMPEASSRPQWVP